MKAEGLERIASLANPNTARGTISVNPAWKSQNLIIPLHAALQLQGEYCVQLCVRCFRRDTEQLKRTMKMNRDLANAIN